jgi:hypothetical protein
MVSSEQAHFSIESSVQLSADNCSLSQN